MVTVTGPTSVAIDSAQGRKLFVFDRVFGEDVDQEGVWEYLTESVDAFVQGYNVSMMAYGQSGAGKSYTMGTSGPEDQADLEVMGESTGAYLTYPILRCQVSLTARANRNRCHSTCRSSTVREIGGTKRTEQERFHVWNAGAKTILRCTKPAR